MSAKKVPSAWVPFLVSLMGAIGSCIAWYLWTVNGGWLRPTHSGEAMLWLASIVIGFWGSAGAIRVARAQGREGPDVSRGYGKLNLLEFGGALLGFFHVLSSLLLWLYLDSS